MSKNRNTLIILRTSILPEIAQKAKKTTSVVYLIAVWEVGFKT